MTVMPTLITRLNEVNLTIIYVEQEGSLFESCVFKRIDLKDSWISVLFREYSIENNSLCAIVERQLNKLCMMVIEVFKHKHHRFEYLLSSSDWLVVNHQTISIKYVYSRDATDKIYMFVFWNTLYYLWYVSAFMTTYSQFLHSNKMNVPTFVRIRWDQVRWNRADRFSDNDDF